MGLFPRNGIWYYCCQVDGKQRERSTGERDKARAYKKVPEIERALHLEARRARVPPLEDALAQFYQYLESASYSEDRVTGYRQFLTPFFRGVGWEGLETARIAEFFAALTRKGNAASSLTTYRYLLSGFVSYALTQRWIDEDPTPPMPTKRGKARGASRRPKRAFTDDEWARFIAAVRKPGRALRYRVMALSGLRSRESALLERRDFELTAASGVWRLRAGASKSKRLDVVPMLPECVELLQPWRDAPPGTKLWGRKVSPRTFDRDLRAAGIEKVDRDGRTLSPHSMRYTFITRLAKSGVPIQTVQKLARHADIKETVNTYLDLGLDTLTDAVQNLRLEPTEPVRKSPDLLP